MNIVIHNDRCNLGCTYCLKKVSGKGKEITVELIEDIFNRYPDEQIDGVTINGYEPLMDFDIIKYLILEKKLKVSFTTNGTLAHREIAYFIRDNKDLFEIMLSLDGDKETTDRNRGEGTYDKIDKELFLNLNATVNMTITRNNINKLGQSIKHIFALGFSDIKFNLDYTKIFNHYDFVIYINQLKEIFPLYVFNKIKLPIRTDIFVSELNKCSLITPKTKREFRYYDIDGKEYPCFVCQAYGIQEEVNELMLSCECKDCNILHLCKNCPGLNKYQAGIFRKYPRNCQMLKAELWFIYSVLSYRNFIGLFKMSQFQKDCMTNLYKNCIDEWSLYNEHLI